MAGAAVREEDRKLTGNPPVMLAWPEMGQRRRIWRRSSSVSGEETETALATPATSARLLWRGGRGRRRGSSQHLEGERGGI
jgi:hypothetical protein